MKSKLCKCLECGRAYYKRTKNKYKITDACGYCNKITEHKIMEEKTEPKKAQEG